MTAYTETDVLVIGAGAGGAAMSKRLSDAGIKVTCLEQGDWLHPMNHAHMYDGWELERLRSWSWHPNVRKFPEDYPVTGNAAPMMMNGVGGSTLHYAGAWPRFKPVDFARAPSTVSKARSTGRSAMRSSSSFYGDQRRRGRRGPPDW